MNNNEPNKIVNKLFKQFLKMKGFNVLDSTPQVVTDFYKKEAILKQGLCDIITVVGAIEVMSKASILKLITMQSSLRFMQFHTFCNYMAKACYDLLNIND